MGGTSTTASSAHHRHHMYSQSLRQGRIRTLVDMTVLFRSGLCLCYGRRTRLAARTMHALLSDDGLVLRLLRPLPQPVLPLLIGHGPCGHPARITGILFPSHHLFFYHVVARVFVCVRSNRHECTKRRKQVNDYRLADCKRPDYIENPT